jgi:aromatic ring-opening dioxygenase catalytic subunit (LigB family)
VRNWDGNRTGLKTPLHYSFRNIVTDYGEENPLLMDYYNFSQEFYKLKFSSRGDARLSQRVVELFDQVPSPFPPSDGPLFLSDFGVTWTTGRYPRSSNAER